MTLARPKNPRGPADPTPEDGVEKGSRSHARALRDEDLDEGFPAQIGEVIDGKYRIERLIGAGGMGLVMGAHDVALDRPVAIKFLHGLNSTTLEANSRFKREARAMAKLHSEHVVRVLDVGTLPSGEPYMVMEHLDGVDLSQLVKQRGYLGVAEAVDYMLAACEAVAEAHAMGIVHRDLKPSNLYLARRLDGTDVLKLLDFGIAKIATDATEDSQSFTTTTALLGSPVYMSPEQLQCSRDADARADIWSLGAIVYRLVAGRPPFVANTMPQICTMILTQHPQALVELVAGMPPALSVAVLRCLEKDPKDRFANVAELARAIAPFGSGRAHTSLERAIAIVYSKSGPHPQTSSSGELYPLRASTSGAHAAYASQPGATAVLPPGRPGRLDSSPSGSGPIPVHVDSAPSLPAAAVHVAGVAPGPGLATSQPSLSVRLLQLRGASSRTLVLGSLGLSVFLGFVIGLLFWIQGRSATPVDEGSFGTSAGPVVALPVANPAVNPTLNLPPSPTPTSPVQAVSAVPSSTASAPVPVNALPTAPLPPPFSPPGPRQPWHKPPPPKAHEPAPPSPTPPSPPPAPVDNSDFGGRK
jgi:serine/threonine protein kinase